MSRPVIRTMTLSVQVTEEAQIVKVSEVLARAQAGLILEGIEASLYSLRVVSGGAGIGSEVDALLNGRTAIVKALAGYNFGTLPNMAEAIQTDPGPLLAALAEAGVLQVDEQYVTTVDVTPGAMQRWSYDPDCARIERRYVTEWRPADARA